MYGRDDPRYYFAKDAPSPLFHPIKDELVEKYPSVTTICSCLDKPNLKQWAANCTSEFIQEWAFLQGETIDTRSLLDILDYARFIYLDISEYATDIGTDVHKYCEEYIRTGKAPMLNKDSNLGKLFWSFVEWYKKYNVIPIAIEHVIWGNGYAGRVDLIAEIDKFWAKSKERVKVVIDFKTGKGTYYPEWKFQLAAYLDGWNSICEPKAEYMGILKFNKQTLRVNYKDFTEDYNNASAAFEYLTKFYWSANEL